MEDNEGNQIKPGRCSDAHFLDLSPQELTSIAETRSIGAEGWRQKQTHERMPQLAFAVLIVNLSVVMLTGEK
jgi:hypothetical protein